MPQGAYLHTAVDHVTFRMIVAKEKRVGWKGFEQWVRKRKENHLLDHEIELSLSRIPTGLEKSVQRYLEAGKIDPEAQYSLEE